MLKTTRWKLLFMDGTAEEVESIGLVVAWIKGKIRAREKKTWLLKVEEA